MELLDHRPGFISVLVSGKDAKATFKQEAGGHRWQRIPPTEKRGRVHTSTITVAVLDVLDSPPCINMRDVEYECKRGKGPGGQHRNKTASCVTVTHKPTGIQATIDGRDQHRNRKLALSILAQRVQEEERIAQLQDRENKRKKQVGSGMRGDKIRTYRERDDRVTDHRTGKTWTLAKWRRGEW